MNISVIIDLLCGAFLSVFRAIHHSKQETNDSRPSRGKLVSWRRWQYLIHITYAKLRAYIYRFHGEARIINHFPSKKEYTDRRETREKNNEIMPRMNHSDKTDQRA